MNEPDEGTGWILVLCACLLAMSCPSDEAEIEARINAEVQARVIEVMVDNYCICGEGNIEALHGR